MEPTVTPATAPLAPINERWPHILRYPLQLGALSTCVALAFAHLIALLPFGFLLDILVWTAFFKYALEVLRWSANGRAEAPEISLTMSDAIARYGLLLLLLSQLLLVLIGYFLGAIPAFICGLVLMLGMPAAMMILALEEGVLRAVNPIVWMMLAQRIGKDYFILVGFFIAALFMQSIFAMLIGKVLPSFMAMLATDFVVNYLMIVNFHLIGSVIYTNRDELGYTGNVELNPHDVPYTDPARKVLDVARERAAGGDIHGAALLLRDELAANTDSRVLHDEYRHWLQQDGDKATLATHAKTYIPILLAQNQDRRAVEVAREALVADPAFALDQAEHVTRLAHAAADAGQTQLAVGLLAGFHKRFRNHADIGRNYLLAAKLWAERMNKEMQARALLQQIKVMLPHDPIVPQVDAYLAYLDKLAATPAKPSAT